LVRRRITQAPWHDPRPDDFGDDFGPYPAMAVISAMTGHPIREMVIVGGGTAGWMTAAALARFLETARGGADGWRVRLIESDAIGTVGVGEATIPQIRLFNAGLGIDEDDFLKATKGSIKLGIEFDGWRRPGERYMHAFGPVGRDLGLIGFHHYWLRGRALGVAAPFGAYSFNEAAAYALRFRRGDNPATALPPLVHAYHFDAGLYAAYLRRYAEARGVERIEGRIARVERDGETGAVAAVWLDDDRPVAGQLFIDCSGFRGLLIEETLGAGYEDWSQWLACDRAMAVPCAATSDFTPYTRATARPAGWQWRIPLQHRTGNGYVYSSAAISDDEAAATLLANLDGEALADPRPLRFTAGRRKSIWVKNVVAIGLASGFLEPLESTSIHLIQSGIARLLAFLPDAGFDAAAIAEYNRQSAWEMTRIRDFIILHYKATARDDTPFWRRARDMAVPPDLADRIDLFRQTARIRRDHDELFTDLAWSQVFIGQGTVPAAHHPLARLLDDDDIAGFLGSLRGAIGHAVAGLPRHADFLAGVQA
jgi:tryptophan 7-halogenase